MANLPTYYPTTFGVGQEIASSTAMASRTDNTGAATIAGGVAAGGLFEGALCMPIEGTVVENVFVFWHVNGSNITNIGELKIIPPEEQASKTIPAKPYIFTVPGGPRKLTASDSIQCGPLRSGVGWHVTAIGGTA